MTWILSDLNASTIVIYILLTFLLLFYYYIIFLAIISIDIAIMIFLLI